MGNFCVTMALFASAFIVCSFPKAPCSATALCVITYHQFAYQLFVEVLHALLKLLVFRFVRFAELL